MSLKVVHEILSKIKSTASTNAKTDLLERYLKNTTFRTVIKLMYSDDLHFKVNKLPKFKQEPDEPPLNSNLFDFLEKLAAQRGTSNANKAWLGKLASADKESYEVVTKIINKDAKCGFGGKTINKAYPDLLFLMPYCRCSTEKNKMHHIDYVAGAIGQEKADGMFVNIIIDKDGSILLRSRNGNIVHQMEHLHKFLHKMPKKYYNTVYMGELLIRINGVILPRKTGNGHLTSCLNNTCDPEIAKCAFIKLWDAVPQKDFWAGTSKIVYKYRLVRVSMFVKDMKLQQLFIKEHDLFLMYLIKTKMLHSLKEAKAFYKQLRLDGKEGAIIKNIHAEWKDHTSPDQVKMKNVSDAELRIVGWKYGKQDTKFRDCMGSVQCESEDGLVQVSVSGFTDEEHFLDWDERISKICTLEFEGLINDKSKPGVWSLYLPRNLEMRPDRTYADTYKEIKSR